MTFLFYNKLTSYLQVHRANVCDFSFQTNFKAMGAVELDLTRVDMTEMESSLGVVHLGLRVGKGSPGCMWKEPVTTSRQKRKLLVQPFTILCDRLLLPPSPLSHMLPKLPASHLTYKT